MRKVLLALLMIVLSVSSFAQNIGDTIVVHPYNWNMTYNSGIRDTTVAFPTDQNLTYEKVIMQYNIHCRNSAVNQSGGNYVACGEWDYSCNTYLHDSSRVDSVLTKTTDYTISNFSGGTFNYTTTPTNTYIQYIQQDVIVNNIISETQSQVGTSSITVPEVIQSNNYNGKSQYLFTQSELINAGAIAGNLDGIIMNVLNAGGPANYLRVRLKHTTANALSDINPDLTNFTEVFFDNTTFSTGLNRLQFYSPFNWDGISNVIVEFSFTNPSGLSVIDFSGDNTGINSGLITSGDYNFNFDGVNYLESNSYKGVGNADDRTVEAWINTTVSDKEIISWGTNATGQKWVFRVNGDGTLRVEVNGGYKYGTTNLSDGQWHHVAAVFTGTDVLNVQLYVDGVLEGTGGSQGEPINTNLTNGINVRVSRGVNNRYFDGIIDDTRIWNTALSATDIQNWMYKSIDASHPFYANIEMDYRLNEATGNIITDATSNGNDATVIGQEAWTKIHGVDLFKELKTTMLRPDVIFLQGNYNLTIVNDTILDTIQNAPNTVVNTTVVPMYGTMQDDSLAQTTTYYWEATMQNVYDPNGVLLYQIPVTPDGSITPADLFYYRRYPMRFELLSLVTPYGIGLDLGPEGETWYFDLTDFSPLFKGNKRITVERGGQWQEEMDIKFLLIVGTPTRDILDVQQIWRNDSKSYSNIMADESFEPRNITINPNATDFKIRSAITGHGQEGEFIPRDHFINLDGGASEYVWSVWKECADNPMYPQGGTWIYDRAGWCPGMPTDLQEYDITNFVTPGQSHSFDYGVQTASGTSNYIVNNQLVSYGDLNFSLDAAIIEITQPTDYIVYKRTNSICKEPTVRVRNTGSTEITSLTIEYWINDDSNHQTYTWTGSLASLAETEIILPATSSGTLWDGIAGLADNVFHAVISDPNGGTDEYSYNNSITSNFTIPDVAPSHFFIQMTTNSFAYETKYELFDESGNLIPEGSRDNMANSTMYRDTVDLLPGCYQFVITDSDDDGISFWANSDGNGACQLREVGWGTFKYFEGDFGKRLVYNFTVDYPLSYHELTNSPKVKVYPNPATTEFIVESEDINEAQVIVYDQLGKEMQLNSKIINDEMHFDTRTLSNGIYIVNIDLNGKVYQNKVVIQ